MTRSEVDVLISGGGVAGLAAAAAFGARGFSVLCVDPVAPATSEAAPDADLRSTAFLQPSIPVLEEAGLWARLAPHAMPLQIMRIVDAGATGEGPRSIRDFDAADISDAPFGWNLPNWLLRREMLARIGTLEGVDFRPGVATRAVLTRTGAALVTLSDGSRVSTRLLIGADGRNSAVRAALGIGQRTTRYGQKAIVFCATHPEPHANTSTEIHRSGGPFTLVPLPDRDGSPSSAVVWMEHGPEALRLAALGEADFEAAISARSLGLLGPLRLVGRRVVWPIISQVAERLVGERTALMAEAAHVCPPIGAQGLNMSLADLRALLDLACANPARLGDMAMLDAYARLRHRDIALRMAGIDLLNRASMTSDDRLRRLRAMMIDVMHGTPPLRRSLMHAGLGMR